MKKDFRFFPRERLTKFLETIETKWKNKKKIKKEKILLDKKK